MENTNKERIEYIDVLRGIAIILMIMGHIGFGKYIDRYIHMFHMPIWFFITGYFYKNRNESLVLTVRKKAKTLLIPYFCLGLLQYPLWILLDRSDEYIFEPLINLLWVNTNLLMPIAGALWFLTSLFFAENIYYVINRLCKNRKIIILVSIIIALFGNYYTTFFEIHLPWAMEAAFVAVGIICIGNFAHIYRNKKWINVSFNLPIKINLLLFLINGVFCFINGYINMRIGMYGFIPLFWINAVVAIVVFWNFSRNLYEVAERSKIVHKIVSMFKQIGENSIVYLCLNQLIILCVRLICNKTCMIVLPQMAYNSLIFIITLPILFTLENIISKSRIKYLFGKF